MLFYYNFIIIKIINLRIVLFINKLLIYSFMVVNSFINFFFLIMPYRRLPNTDAARIKAMKIALEKGKELPPHKLAYSSKTIVRLQKFMPLYEHNLQLYRQTMAAHNKKSRDYYDILKKARIYLTHFIRVMNMAIFERRSAC